MARGCSGVGLIELGKLCVSVVVETCVTVSVDHTAGIIDVAVSVNVSVVVENWVIVEVEASSNCVDTVVSTRVSLCVTVVVNIEVADPAVSPEPGMTRFLKAT